MIFLKDPNVLFLKPRKVAGTSFEIALSRFAQDGDIITPLVPEDEEIRRSLGFRGAQNFRQKVSGLTLREVYRLLRTRTVPNAFWNHMSAAAVRDRLGKAQFSKAYKISIVRNPFDVAISQFHWRSRKMEEKTDFSDWVRRNPQLLGINDQQYFIGSECVVDFFIRYENIAKDIVRLEKDVPALSGLSATMQSITAKGNVRKQGKKIFHYYNNDDDLVATIRFFNRAIVDRFSYELT